MNIVKKLIWVELAYFISVHIYGLNCTRFEIWKSIENYEDVNLVKKINKAIYEELKKN